MYTCRLRMTVADPFTVTPCRVQKTTTSSIEWSFPSNQMAAPVLASSSWHRDLSLNSLNHDCVMNTSLFCPLVHRPLYRYPVKSTWNMRISSTAIRSRQPAAACAPSISMS